MVNLTNLAFKLVKQSSGNCQAAIKPSLIVEFTVNKKSFWKAIETEILFSLVFPKKCLTNIVWYKTYLHFLGYPIFWWWFGVFFSIFNLPNCLYSFTTVDYEIFHWTIVNLYLFTYYGLELMMTMTRKNICCFCYFYTTYTPKNVVFAITKSGEGEKKKEGCVFLP